MADHLIARLEGDMDQRLSRIHGIRPHRLLKGDLPALAKAMVSYMRKEAKVETFFVKDVACVYFSGVGVSTLVRSDDWAKVLPFLEDGTFDSKLTPVVSVRTNYNESDLADIYSSDMYHRILRTLDPLFPVSFP
jgi:hypothetical protein